MSVFSRSFLFVITLFGLLTFSSLNAFAFSTDSPVYDDHCSVIVRDYNSLVSSTEDTDNWNMITFKMYGHLSIVHDGKVIEGDGAFYQTIISNQPFKFKDGVLYGYDNVGTYAIKAVDGYVENYYYHDFSLPNTSGSNASIVVSQPGLTTSVVAYNLPLGFTSDSDTFDYELPINYDINDLNSYPVGSFHVITPVDDIRTSDDYVDFVFGAKMPCATQAFDTLFDINGYNPDLNPRILAKVTKHMKESFKYSVTSSSDNKSYSSGWRGYDGRNTYFEVQFGSPPSEWPLRDGYNMLIKTRIYVGPLTGRLDFKFTEEFFENINYLTPELDSDIPLNFDFTSHTCKLVLNRSTYVDTNMDGIDDNDGSVIPPKDADSEEEITDENLWSKIKHMVLGFPDFVNDLYHDFINMMNNVITMVNSINSKSFELINGFMKFFDFLPSPLPQIIWTALGGLIFFAFVSWVRR